MKSIVYVTSNDVKFQRAAAICKQHGLELTRAELDFQEIQADGETIARHKAEQAYQALKTPLIISDDAWDIPALKGFPGSYMKAINDWFTPEDWLNLTRPLKDRRFNLEEHVVYQDANGQQYFATTLSALLLTESRGVSKHPSLTITSFDGGKHSYAEDIEAGIKLSTRPNNVWQQLADWLATH